MRTARSLIVAATAATAFFVLAPRAGAASCALTGVGGCAAPADPPAAPVATTTTTTQAPAPSPAPPTSLAQARAQLLALVNNERTSRGLAPLAPRSDVDAIASQWSDTMANAGDLSHNEAYFTDESHERLGAQLVGENVGRAGGIDEAHRAFMASDRHRALILDARFTTLGIGATLRDGNWWITEDFLQPRTSAPVRAAAARAPRTARVPVQTPAPPSAPTSVVSVAPAAPEVAVQSAAASAPRRVEVLAATVGPSSPSSLAGEDRVAVGFRGLLEVAAILLCASVLWTHRTLRRGIPISG